MIEVKFSLPELDAALHSAEGEIAQRATRAMRAAVDGAKADLRASVEAAGLGKRLAFTWQGKAYPESGQSLSPGGYLWSKAPGIIDAFSREATIVPVNGAKHLAIPTENVPFVGGGRNKRRMSPVEVEARFDQDLFFLPGRRGTKLAFVNAVQGYRGKGFRPPTARRLRGDKIRKGREAKPVLMFVLARSVRTTKRLDLDAVAARWASRYPGLLQDQYR